MMPLDEVTRRCFPSLATYARKAKWLGIVAIAGLIFTSGLACGLLLGSYRGRVADEDYMEMRKRVVVLEAFTEAHHPKMLTTTRAQAGDMAWRREKETRP